MGAVSCTFTGLAYSEFAARVPIAGSAYTYAYTSFGELLAWLIGWNLTLEYAVSAAAIARSWADYWLVMWAKFGVTMPEWLSIVPLSEDFQLSLFAALVVLACTAVMLVGVKESSTMNIAVTALNVTVLAFVCIAGSLHVNTDNWTVVNDSFVAYGTKGVVSGAGIVFFSFLGFDMVSSLAEEVKNPQRDMPIGIIGSLLISTAIYVAVCLVVTGMVPFTSIMDAKAPLSAAFEAVGMHWASYIVTLGSILGLTTATFTCLLGQPRVFYRMATDGLMFPLFGQLSENYVPIAGTLITGAVTALIAFFVSLGALADAISVGTLVAFTIVDAGVVVLRARTATNAPHLFATMAAFCACCMLAAIGFHIDLPLGVIIAAAVAAFLVVVYLWWAFPAVNIPSTFQCPFVPFIPCAGIAVNIVMMSGLDASAWLRLALWTFLGLAIYFSYSIRHSKLRIAAAAGRLGLQGAAGGSLEQTELDTEALLSSHRSEESATATSTKGSGLGSSAALQVVRKGGYEVVRDDMADGAVAGGHAPRSYGPTGNLQYSQLPRSENGPDLDADDEAPATSASGSSGSSHSGRSLLG